MRRVPRRWRLRTPRRVWEGRILNTGISVVQKFATTTMSASFWAVEEGTRATGHVDVRNEEQDEVQEQEEFRGKRCSSRI